MDGPTLGRAPLSVNLYYLVTTMGLDSTDTRGAHRVLGDVMLTLHDHPAVAKDDPVLDPGLRQEVEQLKITLEPLATEELSNLWTATTSPYRLSVVYRVTVVQLESALPRRFPRPVGVPPDAGPRVVVVPLDRPRIAAVGVAREKGGEVEVVPYARVGDTLVVDGERLHPGRRVLLGPLDASAAVGGASTGSRLRVAVPDDPALQAGIQRLQVVGDIAIGEPPHAVPAMRSNVAAFVLIPTLGSTAPAGGDPGTSLTVTGARLVADAGPTMVLIGDHPVTPDGGATATRLTVTVPQLPAGVYPVSVRVNGAESIDPASFEVTS